jgi:hypothetical protein
VTRPVKRIAFVPAPTVAEPKGKGFLPRLFGGSGSDSVAEVLSGIPVSGADGSSALLGSSLLGGTTVLGSSSSDSLLGSSALSGLSGSAATTTTTTTTAGDGGYSAATAVTGTVTGTSDPGVPIDDSTIITTPDGRTIPVSSLRAGDRLPPGSTVRSASGMVLRAGAPAPAPAAAALPGMTPGMPAAPAPAPTPATPPGFVPGGAGGAGVQLVTNPDGTISAVPMAPLPGAQGGSGSSTSWSGGNSTTYVSGLGAVPNTPGAINGFGVSNAGFPIVGNTPVAFLPPERAALYPSANTTVSWPCGDKPVGTEIVKGIPCGVDLVAVPVAALPPAEVERLKSNFGAGSGVALASARSWPESARVRTVVPEAARVRVGGPAGPLRGTPLSSFVREGPKEAALQQGMDEKLLAFMQRVSHLVAWVTGALGLQAAR